jgi:hypothetical protein
MADVVRLGPVASPAVASHSGGQVGRRGRRRVGQAFHHFLTAAMARSHAPGTRGSATSGAAGVQTAAFHVPLVAPRAAPAEQPVSVIPAHSDAALQQAMNLEGVPGSGQAGLRFIMAQESSGKVDTKNPVHSARGLLQLTAANYHLNPNGAGSFGNAIEEAQGGIRYIQQRYGTADHAVAFWRQHRWY